MISLRYTTYVFDLDGTLLDTLNDLHAAVSHAFTLQGLPVPHRDDVRRCLGNGYARLLRDLTSYGEHDPRTHTLLHEFQSYYECHLADLTAPYEGILPLLHTLRERGAKAGIVSNKGHEAVQQLAHRFFDGLVDVAVGKVRRYAESLALMRC